MEWLVFALLSTPSFALAVIVDKLLLIQCIKNSDAYLLALMLFQKIFVILVSVSVGAGLVYPLSVFGMLACTAQAAMYASYLRALQVEEASRVTSLIFVYPV
jgi:uncharacterized membrane protein